MRKNWLIAFVGAALLAIVPATALAHGDHPRHHAKRQHRVRTHLRHITAADSSPGANAGTTTGSGASSTDNAGKVTSFDTTTGKLVITLTDGSAVSGVVNGNTELKCDSASTRSSAASGPMQSDLSRDGGGDQNSGDTQSSSGDQSSSTGQGDQNDQNDQNDQGDQNDAGNGQAACTTTNLTPGTVVHEAELSVSSPGSIWRQVDLVIG
jgi:hypothetical protein